MAQLVPDRVFAFPLRVLLVERHDIDESLWVLLLLSLGDSLSLEKSLPLFRQSLFVGSRNMSATIRRNM